MKKALALAALLASCSMSPDEVRRLTDQELIEALPDAHRGDRNLMLQQVIDRGIWTPTEVCRIRSGEIWVGATWEQVLAARGRPVDVSTYQSGSGQTDVWGYGHVRRTVITLHNGRCESWLTYDF